jgi:hypothetical protein
MSGSSHDPLNDELQARGFVHFTPPPEPRHPRDDRYSWDTTDAELRRYRREDAKRLSRQRRAIRQAARPRTRAPRLRLIGSGGRPRERRAAATRSSERSGDSGRGGDEPPGGDEWPPSLRPFTFAAFDGLISRRIPGHVRADLFFALPPDVQREAWHDLRDAGAER